MNSVSELIEWVHEVSGHKDGCPVLFVDDNWFSDPDIYKNTLKNCVTVPLQIAHLICSVGATLSICILQN